MKKFLEKSKLRNGIRAAQIDEVWEKIMGKTIAKYTDKIEIVQQTLFIHTTIAPLKQEIQFQKQQIIQRINEEFQETIVKDVVVK
ncbi:MAG: DciA family protein [Chitinophagaceae bacterium]